MGPAGLAACLRASLPATEGGHQGHTPQGCSLRRGRPVCCADLSPGGLLFRHAWLVGRCCCLCWSRRPFNPACLPSPKLHAPSSRCTVPAPSLPLHHPDNLACAAQVPSKPFLPEEEEPGEPQASYSYALAEAAAKARGVMQAHEVWWGRRGEGEGNV